MFVFTLLIFCFDSNQLSYLTKLDKKISKEMIYKSKFK